MVIGYEMEWHFQGGFEYIGSGDFALVISHVVLGGVVITLMGLSTWAQNSSGRGH